MSENSRTPWVTLGLIVANLAMAFAIVFFPQLIDTAMFDPRRITPLSPLLCLFAHQNLVHLLGNMIFLAAVGPLVEFTRGGWRFAVIYLAGGLLGVNAHYFYCLLTPPGTPLLGASAAVASVVGYCAIRFARTKVPLAPNFGVPVGAIAILWLLIQVAGSFIQVGEQLRGGTAYWAHLGGFLAGLAFAFIFGGLRDARHQYGHEVLERMNIRGPAATLTAAEAILNQQPQNRTAQWQRIEALHGLDEGQKCLAAIDKFIVKATPLELAQALTILSERNALDTIRSVSRLKYADQLASTNPELQLKLIQSVADQENDLRQPDALVSLLTLLPDPDSEEYKSTANHLETLYPHHPATESARQRGFLK